jgi:hypothetical protein
MGNDNSISIDGKILEKGKTVFFSKTELHWTQPFAKKRHHANETRSVTLRGKVVSVQEGKFMATLLGNNNFEKDGETFVFSKNNLLVDQNYSDLENLGKWKNDPWDSTM